MLIHGTSSVTSLGYTSVMEWYQMQMTVYSILNRLSTWYDDNIYSVTLSAIRPPDMSLELLTQGQWSLLWTSDIWNLAQIINPNQYIIIYTGTINTKGLSKLTFIIKQELLKNICSQHMLVVTNNVPILCLHICLCRFILWLWVGYLCTTTNTNFQLYGYRITVWCHYNTVNFL